MRSAGENKKARSAGCSNYVSKAPQPMSTTSKNQAIPVLSPALIAAAAESANGTWRTFLSTPSMSAFGG
jgi:hypothetical protein